MWGKDTSGILSEGIAFTRSHSLQAMGVSGLLVPGFAMLNGNTENCVTWRTGVPSARPGQVLLC